MNNRTFYNEVLTDHNRYQIFFLYVAPFRFYLLLFCCVFSFRYN